MFAKAFISDEGKVMYFSHILEISLLIPVNSQNPKLLPHSEITRIHGNMLKPSLSEGFVEIKNIPFVFRGDEKEREIWSMRLQVDGK